jgi:hypothetical protein
MAPDVRVTRSAGAITTSEREKRQDTGAVQNLADCLELGRENMTMLQTMKSSMSIWMALVPVVLMAAPIWLPAAEKPITERGGTE